jgi:hypothetical protein
VTIKLYVMSPKYRYIYLTVGAIGFILLCYQIIGNLPEIDPVRVLLIAVPDMLFVFLAYKTYPPEPETKSSRSFSQRKVSNY